MTEGDGIRHALLSDSSYEQKNDYRLLFYKFRRFTPYFQVLLSPT